MSYRKLLFIRNFCHERKAAWNQWRATAVPVPMRDGVASEIPTRYPDPTTEKTAEAESIVKVRSVQKEHYELKRFQGKVAVVTGGNSGIGLGVAKAYAREGAQVAITGRNEKTLEVAAKEIGDGPRHSIGQWQSEGNRSCNAENQPAFWTN
jgi:hypothetical protein